MSPRKKPWDRIPNETSKAYDSFCDYLRQGSGRSVNRVKKRGGKGAEKGRKEKAAGHITRWSREHNWLKRVAAFDAEQQASHNETHAETIEKRRKEIMDCSDELLQATIKIATGKDAALPGQVTALQMLLNRIGLVEWKPDEQAGGTRFVILSGVEADADKADTDTADTGTVPAKPGAT